MIKLVYSALALTLVSVPGIASENEWSSLDQEISNLSSSLSAQTITGPKLGGWVISSFRWSDDAGLIDDDGDEEDALGFQLDSVRIEVTGDAGSDYGYKISFDLSSLEAELRDAYATWKIGDAVVGKMGRFKPYFLRSALVGDNRLLFLERTTLGDAYSDRDIGLQFNGNFDTIFWAISAQNGSDGIAEDMRFTGRIEVNLMGAGAGKAVEGAYGAGEGTHLTAGLGIMDDGGVDDGMSLAVDAQIVAGPFSAAAEVVDQDEDIGDNTPWDVTLSYMFTDMYEVAGRYEDFDDDADSTRWVVGVNRYVQGHDIKWQLQYASADSDDDALEADELGLGLAVSF